MPVFGAVATLATDAGRAREALVALAAEARITLGDVHGRKAPFVLETTERREDRAVWEAIEALPGVANLEVAFADFSDLVEPREVSP